MWTPQDLGAAESVYTNTFNPPSRLNRCLMTQWCSDGKRMSISSSITVITLYDSTAITTNYHREKVCGKNKKQKKKQHTFRVIHCMLLTASVRYLKLLFSSALMGAEMSFALWRSRGQITSLSVNDAGGCAHPNGVKSLQLLVFLPVVAQVSRVWMNMNETPSSSTWIIKYLQCHSDDSFFTLFPA